MVDDYAAGHAVPRQQIREVEGEVFSPSRANPAERIYTLKREVLELHDAVAPLLEPVEALARGRHGLIDDEMRPYFRDVHDHLLRVVDQVEGFRELLTERPDGQRRGRRARRTASQRTTRQLTEPRG